MMWEDDVRMMKMNVMMWWLMRIERSSYWATWRDYKICPRFLINDNLLIHTSHTSSSSLVCRNHSWRVSYYPHFSCFEVQYRCDLWISCELFPHPHKRFSLWFSPYILLWFNNIPPFNEQSMLKWPWNGLIFIIFFLHFLFNSAQIDCNSIVWCE